MVWHVISVLAFVFFISVHFSAALLIIRNLIYGYSFALVRPRYYCACASYFVFLFEIIVSLAVARGSCVMSSRQSSRADLGGIPEGDPIENKVCFLFICLHCFIAICRFVLAFVLFYFAVC